MRATKGNNLVKLPPGLPQKHGGYSYFSTGRLPRHRRYIRRYLTACREGLIRDLGPAEENLTTGQLILVDRAIGKLGLLRCIEEHVRESGVMAGPELAPSLGRSYLAYSNSLRLDLQVLGIDRRGADKAPSPLELAQIIDAEKAAAADGGGNGRGEGKDAGPCKKACPGRSQCEGGDGCPETESES